MSYIGRLQNLRRYGLLTRSILLRLSRIGVAIEPYILYYQQSLNDPVALADLDYRVERISLDNIDYINEQLPGPDFYHTDPLKVFRDRLSSGNVGIILIHDDELAGYSWANLRYCRHRKNILFELNQEEAYLYDTYVGDRSRGRGFASVLHHRLMEELHRTGRRKCFSISEYFNTPARMFKRRLRAKPLETRRFLNIFYRGNLDIRLGRSSGALTKRVPLIVRKKVAGP